VYAKLGYELFRSIKFNRIWYAHDDRDVVRASGLVPFGGLERGGRCRENLWNSIVAEALRDPPPPGAF